MNQDGQLHLILCLSLWITGPIQVIFVVIHGGSHRRNGREKFKQTKPNQTIGLNVEIMVFCRIQ